MASLTITRLDLVQGLGTSQTTAQFSIPGSRGRKGDKGDTGEQGDAGPNLITDATALGTLTAIADPAFLLVGNAAGTFARRLTHPSPSPAGSFTLASITIDAFGRVLSASNGTVTAATITDSTATGRAVLTAADAAAARSAIGAGTGNALTSGTLAQFAATTSAELAGVLTDETGSGGGFVRATGPTLTTPSVSGTLAVYQTGQSGASTARVNVSHDGTFGNITNPNSTAGFFFNDASGRATYFARNALRNSVNSVISWTPNDGDTAPDVGLARVDSNTIEVNNGTRTANGGALRRLSVSSLTCPGEINTGGTYYSVRTLRLGAPNDSQPSIYVRNSIASSYFQNGTVACIAFRVNPQAATTPAIADLQFGNSNTTALPRMVLNHNQLSGYTAVLNAAVTVDGSLTVTGTTTLGTYTVATLPSASANAGAFAQVTDSNSTTNGNTVAGGGSNRVPVFSNGTNWIIK